MKTNAAVLFAPEQEWQVVELDLDEPRAGEVLLRVEYSGLCHSDEHIRHGLFGRYPVVGGHEGSGVVEAVGPGVTAVEVGDHVVTSFCPSCGHCRWCMTSRSYLCDQGCLRRHRTPSRRHLPVPSRRRGAREHVPARYILAMDGHTA
jgi:alcohol dehydrogenase (nicotinoprotein)